MRSIFSALPIRSSRNSSQLRDTNHFPLDLRARSRLQAARGDEIDGAAEGLFEPILQAEVAIESCRPVEIDKNIDVAVRA